MKEEKKYYTKSELKERGWTAAMIRDLLGEADLTWKPFSGFKNTFKYWYLESRVEAIEKTEAFQDRLQSKAARKKANIVYGEYERENALIRFLAN